MVDIIRNFAEVAQMEHLTVLVLEPVFENLIEVIVRVRIVEASKIWVVILTDTGESYRVFKVEAPQKVVDLQATCMVLHTHVQGIGYLQLTKADIYDD